MDAPLEKIFTLISRDLEAAVQRANPWWFGDPIGPIPAYRRLAFQSILNGLHSGLAPVTALRGPRQVGKSTLLVQTVEHLLQQGVHPRRIFRLQFDELPEFFSLKHPILALSDWFSQTVLKTSFAQAALDGAPAYLLLDEVQNLPDWAPQIKYLVDHHPVRVLVTGSSALRIEQGRDSLAGRINTVELGPLRLSEVAAFRRLDGLPPFLEHNGLAPLKDKAAWIQLAEHGRKHQAPRREAFRAYSQRGGYPIAQARFDLPWEQVADALNETVIQRAIQHDLRVGERGKKRDVHLLEEVFRLACRYAGQSPSQAFYLAEVQQAMQANIGWQRILAYLRFLDATLLLRLIEPLELRLKRRRGASKLCLCDPALRAAWLQEIVPLAPEDLESHSHLSELAGHLAESVAGYYLRSIKGLDVAHFPERASEPEIDFVLTIGEQRIPVEVKYRRRVDYKDTLGLRAFIEKAVYNAPFGILVTLHDDVVVDDPRLVTLPLSTLLLLR